MRIVEAAATALGWLARVFLLLVGPLLLVQGIWMFSHRVALIAAGVLLILFNLQGPSPSKGGK